MNYEVIHTTEYIYDDTTSLCHNTARLIPRTTNNQECKKVDISISPKPEIFNEYVDFFGNHVIYFAIQHEHKKLTVTVTSVISKDNTVHQNDDNYISWERAKQMLSENDPAYLDARQYIHETPLTEITPEITEYAQCSFIRGRSLYEAAYDLMKRIYQDFEFKPGFTTVSTPLATVMHQRKGVCQDFAHLGITCIRSMGLAARYVSGYLETLPPPGQKKLTGVDASHAWFSVFIPQTGWVDFDPTNNQIPSHQHITIGWGRDYADITPLKGIMVSSGQHWLNVSVDVKRLGS